MLVIGKMFPVKQATHKSARGQVKACKNSKSTTRLEEVKVDVVADNGSTWIRVNTYED